MADITMCPGERIDSMRTREICPLRNDCYRYKAKPSILQSYFMSIPLVAKECIEYVPIKKPSN